MEVYTLVGKSGTGKSFHAMNLCKKLNIEGIIDDGLFIYKSTVVAGMSAKRAATKIGAVKVALFLDDAMCQEVSEAIREKAPASILILGTSKGMTDKIIARLKLLDNSSDDSSIDPVHRIQIEDITTEEERQAAKTQREKLGKHVIPAPALQLKRNFAGYFMDPLRLFRGKDQGAAAERTVVRPTYSYMGEYYVAEKVLDDIIVCIGHLMPQVRSVIRVSHDPLPESYKMTVAVKLSRDCLIWETAQDFQERIIQQIELMTAFNVTEVNVEVRAVE